MNKKTLTICLSVLVACTVVWIAGCEKEVDTPQDAAKMCPAGCTKPCCPVGAEPKTCPLDCTKPCCATKDATEVKACPVGCTKPCCAVKTATDAVEEAAKTCCGADPTKCCGKAVAEAVEKAAEDVKEAIDPHAGHDHD